MTTTTNLAAWGDQYRAAAAHARRIVSASGTPTRGTLQPTTRAWLVEQADTALRALSGPNARQCAHVGRSPQVLCAAAWRPGLLVCPSCIGLLRPDPAEDHRCDRCRKPADPIHSVMTQFGPILYGYGLCRSCATHTGHPTVVRPARSYPR